METLPIQGEPSPAPSKGPLLPKFSFKKIIGVVRRIRWFRITRCLVWILTLYLIYYFSPVKYIADPKGEDWIWYVIPDHIMDFEGAVSIDSYYDFELLKVADATFDGHVVFKTNVYERKELDYFDVRESLDNPYAKKLLSSLSSDYALLLVDDDTSFSNPMYRKVYAAGQKIKFREQTLGYFDESEKMWFVQEKDNYDELFEGVPFDDAMQKISEILREKAVELESAKSQSQANIERLSASIEEKENELNRAFEEAFSDIREGNFATTIVNSDGLEETVEISIQEFGNESYDLEIRSGLEPGVTQSFSVALDESLKSGHPIATELSRMQRNLGIIKQSLKRADSRIALLSDFDFFDPSFVLVMEEPPREVEEKSAEPETVVEVSPKDPNVVSYLKFSSEPQAGPILESESISLIFAEETASIQITSSEQPRSLRPSDGQKVLGDITEIQSVIESREAIFSFGDRGYIDLLAVDPGDAFQATLTGVIRTQQGNDSLTGTMGPYLDGGEDDMMLYLSSESGAASFRFSFEGGTWFTWDGSRKSALSSLDTGLGAFIRKDNRPGFVYLEHQGEIQILEESPKPQNLLDLGKFISSFTGRNARAVQEGYDKDVPINTVASGDFQMFSRNTDLFNRYSLRALVREERENKPPLIALKEGASYSGTLSKSRFNLGIQLYELSEPVPSGLYLLLSSMGNSERYFILDVK